MVESLKGRKLEVFGCLKEVGTDQWVAGLFGGYFKKDDQIL